MSGLKEKKLFEEMLFNKNDLLDRVGFRPRGSPGVQGTGVQILAWQVLGFDSHQGVGNK